MNNRFSSRANSSGLHLPGWLASLSLLALLVSGCTALGPDFEAPEAPVAEEWVEVDDAEVTDQPVGYPQWWTVFDDPVLNQLIEMAQSQNLTLRSAGLRVLQAHAQLGIATGSKYPQVQQVTGSASRVDISDNASDNYALLENSFALYNLDFNLSWEIDFWGRFSRLIESSAAQLQASVAGYDTVMVALTAEVATAYVLIRTLEQRIELAKSNVGFQERALRIADVKFRNGAVTELDVQQARTVLNSTQALIPALETSLRQTRNALGVLLGLLPRDVDKILADAAPVPVPPAQISVGMPQDLIRRRPDIRQAEWVLAAQSAQIGVAVTELYPHFSLGGTIGVATTDIGGKDVGDLFESGSVGGLLYGGFTWNVLNYGRLKNNIRFQDARFQQLLVEYQNKVLQAQAEVDNTIVAYLRAQVRAGFLAQSADAAQRSVQLSFIQYREGATDFNSVLLTLTEQFQQQDALTETNGTIATNLISMYKALGGGWDVDSTRVLEDYVDDEDQQQLRTRTKYWRDTFPE